MNTPIRLSRLRGAVVGGTSAVTGVLAHATAQGMLPETSVLLMVGAAAVAVGIGVRAAPSVRALPALVAGQALVHLLLVLTSGHHHDLFTAPMAVMHTAGTIAALLLLCGAEILVRAVSALAVRASSLRLRPRTGYAAVVVSAPPQAAPAALVFLGAVGRRGPPFSV